MKVLYFRNLGFFIFSLIALILSPKLFLFLYLLIKASVKKENSNSLRYVELVIALYFVFIISIMLADRPYYVGKEIGFGEDMNHYYNAFEWIISHGFYEFFTNFSTITNLTGSAEPLFWLIIKFISLIFQDPYYIHVGTTFLGCFLIYLAGHVWDRCGILFLFFYTNTITFFAFQGSAIRSGLAFSFATLGYVYFLKNKNKWFQLIAPLIHFSMIPFPLITYVSVSDLNSNKKRINLFLFLILFSTLFVVIGLNSVDGGLGAKVTARVSENDLDISSLIQFLFESLFTIFLVFLVFKDKVDKKIKLSLVLFFFSSILLLIISPTAFSRFYRYEYIILILVYYSIYIKSKAPIRILIITSSFSWYVFLGFDRFIGVFGNDFFDYINLVFWI